MSVSKAQQGKIATVDALNKLRALINENQFQTILENRNAASQRKRLREIQEEIKRIAKRLARPLCNCRGITVAESWRCDEFAKEMEIVCPIHGQRRLGAIVTVSGYPSAGNPGDHRLQELVREYWRRC
jgi:hypothetical protein